MPLLVRTSLLTAAVTLLPLAAAQSAEPAASPLANRIALVLDASGSMNANLPDGQTRFAAAKEAVARMVGSLSPTTEIALRVYGHQSKPAEKNCQDTELVVPFGPASDKAAEITSKVAGLHALGFTPISLTLQQAAEDLAQDPKPGSTVILVSDGKETCKSDPCAVAAALAKSNAALVVHTIGFGVDDATRRQLQCIANNARGSYYDANSMGELTAKLGEAANAGAKTIPAAPTEKKQIAQTGILTVKGIEEAGVGVFNSTSSELVGTVGTVGHNREELPPGVYGIQFLNGMWTGIEIKAGKTTEIVPGYLKIENPGEALVQVIEPETGEEAAAIHQKALPVVAMVPGRYTLRFNEGFEMRDVEFKAGHTTIIKPAIIRISTPGQGTIYAIETADDGTRGIGGIPGQDISVPAGKYVVFDPQNEENRVEVDAKEGQVYDITMPE